MIEAYPLYWPEGRARAKWRGGSSFGRQLTFGSARDRVLRELGRLGASNIVMSTNVPLRRDGLPMATANEPSDPGVAVYFNYKKRPMCFACDKYSRVKENMHAIGLTIEAIRGIERWGSSDMMERAFRGFTALDEQAASSWRGTLGFEPAAKVTEDALESAFREKVKVAHPDAGGKAEDFHRLVTARKNARKELGIEA